VQRRGSYGFHLGFPEGTPPFVDLIAQAPDAPGIEISWRPGPPARDREDVSPNEVALWNSAASGFTATRDPARIELMLYPPREDEALVHPVLTVPLAIMARWRGLLTLHGGAFAHQGRAYAILGTREAGKSTMLAMMASLGKPVVADDLLVVQGHDVRSGPSCVDLRPDAALRFPAARQLGIVGDRPRARLSTAPAPDRMRLAGLFVLDWHQAPGVLAERIGLREALNVVLQQEYIALHGDTDALAALRVAALPMWRVMRRPRWEDTEECVEALLGLADSTPLAAQPGRLERGD
jgi:hypothetical protein